MGLDDIGDFASDIGDFAEEAFDVASETLSDGFEFLSDGFADGFDQLQEQVGSFAGDGSWFDTNFPGDIFGGPVEVGLGASSGGFFDSISDFATDLKISVLGPELVAGPGAGQSFFGQLVDKASSFVPSFDTLADRAQKAAVDAVTGQIKSVAASAVNTAISSVAGAAVSAGVPASLVNRAAGTVSAGTTGLIYGGTTSFPSASNILDSAVTFVSGSATAAAQTVAQSAVNTVNGTVVAGSNLVNSAISTVTAPALATVRNLAGTVTVTNVNGQPLTVQAPVSASQVDKSASNVGYITVQNPEDGTYYVQNEATGAIVASGLTEQAAILRSQDQTFIDAGAAPDPNLATPPANAGSVAANAANNAPVADPNAVGPPVSLGDSAAIAAAAASNAANAALADAAARTTALIKQAQNQQTIRAQRQNQAQAGDWRVRLRLAPTSNYLYNASDCGPVLWPLRNTDGVIFPYTPSIDTSYKANYSTYDLTHSNYRGYFYQNSYVDGINIKATFTAQDTAEANYLLAVIHFFRSVTKMFYGQDAERGSPPPLTYLSGLGDFQFNEHPCVVSQFNYNLPADVNYIRAQSVLVNGTNLLSARRRQTVLGNPLSYAIQRLSTLGQGIQPGAVDAPVAPQGSLGAKNPTYVPTKMDINLTLLPIQSRSQVSQLFSLKGFANGNLLKGGFW